MSHKCRETLAVLTTAAAINGLAFSLQACTLAFWLYRNSTSTNEQHAAPGSQFAIGAALALPVALYIAFKTKHLVDLCHDSVIIVAPIAGFILNLIAALIIGLANPFGYEASELAVSNETGHAISGVSYAFLCLTGAAYAGVAIAVRECCRRRARLSYAAAVFQQYGDSLVTTQLPPDMLSELPAASPNAGRPGGSTPV